METLHDNVSDLMSELQEIEYDIHMTKRSEVILRSSLRLDMLSLLSTNFDLFEEHHISVLTKYFEYAHKWIEDENDRVMAVHASADQTKGGQESSPVEELNHYVSNYVELAKQFLVSFDELVRRKEAADTFAVRSAERFSDCPHIRTSDDWVDVDPERSVRIVICDDCGVTVDPNIDRANQSKQNLVETNQEETDTVADVVREHLLIRCNCPSFRRTTTIGCIVCPPNPRWEKHLLTNCPLCSPSEAPGNK